MNKKQFSKYLSDSFGLSPEASNHVVMVFSEGVNEALSEGHNIKIDNFCIKPSNTATSKFKEYLKYQCEKEYFKTKKNKNNDILLAASYEVSKCPTVVWFNSKQASGN